MDERLIFEIPIYRSDGSDLLEAYERRKQQDEVIRKHFGFENVKLIFPERRYNDVIGWIEIRLSVSGFRAEYYFVRQRVVRGLKNKEFENKGKLFGYSVARGNWNSESIFSGLKNALYMAIDEHFPKYCVDLECFESLGPFVDWAGMMRQNSKGK